MRQVSCRRAYVLVELLITLALCGFAMELATRTSLQMRRAYDAARLAGERSMRIDHLGGVLTNDIWSAAKIEAGADSSITIESGGNIIRWRATGDAIEREQAGTTTAWHDLGGPASFAVEDAGVTLTVRSKRFEQGSLPRVIHFTSQLIAASGSKGAGK